MRSRLGRRHPFLYAAPIPLAICFALIYMPPAGLSEPGLFAWFTVFALLQRQAMRGCFRNDNYRMLLFGLIFLSVTIGTRETLNSYTSLFFWELTESKLRVFGGAAPIAFTIAFFLTVRLHDRSTSARP